MNGILLIIDSVFLIIYEPKKLAVINLAQLQSLFEKNKISSDVKIDLKFLKTHKLIKKNVTKFKILGVGDVKNKINLDTDLLSKTAKSKLTKIGSSFISKNNS